MYKTADKSQDEGVCNSDNALQEGKVLNLAHSGSTNSLMWTV